METPEECIKKETKMIKDYLQEEKNNFDKSINDINIRKEKQINECDKSTESITLINELYDKSERTAEKQYKEILTEVKEAEENAVRYCNLTKEQQEKEVNNYEEQDIEGGKRRTRKRGKKARRSKKNNKKRKGKKSKRTRKHK